MTDFRPMRRIRQLLNDEEAKKILANGTHGVLAVSGDDDYPYAVPLSVTIQAIQQMHSMRRKRA